MPKRVILMYITEISGHHSATLAIEKAIKLLEPDTEVMNINAFNYTNPISEKVINRLYMGVIKRAPQIWDYLYDNPAIIKNLEAIKKAVHKFNSGKLNQLFERFKPDVIACAQAFPCGMCADYKKSFNSQIPLVAVLTDFVPHSFWIYDTVNYYIAPSEDIAQQLIKKGVPQEKIKPYGIPFDHKFNQPVDKLKTLQRLRLKENTPTILIMGGGQGLGPIKTIIKSLEKVGPEIQEIIICGTNKKLYKSLRRKIKKYKKKILLYGFSHNINELMSISDVIISKPGGVTTAEVLSKNIPMIIVKPIPGQEANNTAYLTQKNAAIKLDEPDETHLIIEELLNNPAKLKELSSAAGGIAKPGASMDIARLLLGLPNV